MQDKLKKIGKGAMIAGLGAFLTYLGQYAIGQDFGSLTPIVVAMLSVGVNALRKFSETTPTSSPGAV